MRFLWVILAALVCAGCPRTSNTTLPQPKTAETAASKPKLQVQPQSSAGAVIPPPINYLALGSAMTAAPLPADVISQYPQAKLSADSSQLETRTANGEVDWIQSFTTPATNEELLRYYQGIFDVKGFARVKQDAPPATSSGFDHRWRSADQRHEVHVYSANDRRSLMLYLIHIHELSETDGYIGTP